MWVRDCFSALVNMRFEHSAFVVDASVPMSRDLVN